MKGCVVIVCKGKQASCQRPEPDTIYPVPSTYFIVIRLTVLVDGARRVAVIVALAAEEGESSGLSLRLPELEDGSLAVVLAAEVQGSRVNLWHSLLELGNRLDGTKRCGIRLRGSNQGRPVERRLGQDLGDLLQDLSS